MLIATALGIYGQSLAYFVDEQISVNGNSAILISSLPIFTVISVLIYVAVPLLAYIMRFDNRYSFIYIIVFGIIGFCVSSWSIFVCLMWWG